jgi:murein DD-endopeptidase MepM/ murein hydrolase activator NlpD
MYMRRILLACSLAASAASVAFADLVALESKPDRLEALTRTLAQGSYLEPNLIEPQSSVAMSVELREKTVELNNESLEKKYGKAAIASSANLSNNPYSWLVAHPLPNARISSNYGGRTMGGRAENHSGLDLAAPTGTPIYATGPGIVTKSGWGSGYGQYVEINHGNGYITRYAHASRLIASVGDNVTAGEHIANVGCTGRCTGPHLHYEVVKDGQRKNPSTYLAMLP